MMRSFGSVVLAVVLATSAMFSFGQQEAGAVDMARHVVLLVASVGKAWDLSHYPKRMNESRYTFESVAIYQFDKSEALEELLMRPERKFKLTLSYIKGFFRPPPKRPDILIIKECAAYFPGNIEHYKALVEKWVSQARAKNIKVLLATTVPVTHKRAESREGQNRQIHNFNQWLRDYAKTEGLGLLDLEAELAISELDRSLNPDLAAKDGLHLNSSAYERLDQLLYNMLTNTTP